MITLMRGRMMKKQMLLAVLLTGMILVQGCGGYWINPNVTDEQARRDFAECGYEATKYSYTPMGRFDNPIVAGIQEGMQYNKIMTQCMKAKGYHKSKTRN